MKQRTPLLILSLLLSTAAPPALAQVSADQVNSAFDAQRTAQASGNFGGNLGFGGIGEDLFLNLTLRLSFDREMWGIGLQAPVRLRVVDKDPQQDDDYTLIRKEDWDEPMEFLRALRYVYIGQRDKKGLFYVRIGELNNLTLGHGTMLHRYYNNIDPNTWHTGVNAAVNIGPFGADVMMSDVVDPQLVGGRLQLRPVQLIEGEESYWRRFYIGASVVSDVDAPTALEMLDHDGNPSTPEIVDVDSKGQMKVATNEALVMYGVDVGFEVLDTELLKITPYIDFNHIAQLEHGNGLHMGVLWKLNLPMLIDNFVADVRTEYRVVSGDYLGPYVNATYDVERFQFLLADKNGANSVGPKLAVLQHLAQDTKHGYFFDLMFGLPSWIFVGGSYIDYASEQADGYLQLSLEVPALKFVEFSAVYMRVNVDGPGDLFELDEKSAIIAQAQVPFSGVFNLQARWWRIWQAVEGEGYEPVDDWSVGLGFDLDF